MGDVISITRRIAIREGGVGSGYFGHTGRPGMRGGSTPAGSQQHMSRTQLVGTIMHAFPNYAEGEGITINLRGNVPQHGFAVGGAADMAVEEPPITRHDVSDYIDHNIEELTKANHYFGGWVDGGRVYFNVSTIRASKLDALAEGRSRDQIAIFNLDDGRGYRTMTDGKRPSESKGDPITEAAKKRKPGPVLYLFGKDVSPEVIVRTLNAEARRQRLQSDESIASITIRRDSDRG